MRSLIVLLIVAIPLFAQSRQVIQKDTPVPVPVVIDIHIVVTITVDVTPGPTPPNPPNPTPPNPTPPNPTPPNPKPPQPTDLVTKLINAGKADNFTTDNFNLLASAFKNCQTIAATHSQQTAGIIQKEMAMELSNKFKTLPKNIRGVLMDEMKPLDTLLPPSQFASVPSQTVLDQVSTLFKNLADACTSAANGGK